MRFRKSIRDGLHPKDLITPKIKVLLQGFQKKYKLGFYTIKLITIFPKKQLQPSKVLYILSSDYINLLIVNYYNNLFTTIQNYLNRPNLKDI